MTQLDFICFYFLLCLGLERPFKHSYSYYCLFLFKCWLSAETTVVYTHHFYFRYVTFYFDVDVIFL